MLLPSRRHYYLSLSQIPLLLMTLFPLCRYSTEKKWGIFRVIIFLIIIVSTYYFFIRQLLTKIPKKILIYSDFSNILLHFFKDNFYIIQSFNVFLIIATIYIICEIFLQIIKEIFKKIPVIDEKKIVSEIFIFLILSLLIFLFVQWIEFYSTILYFYTLGFSLSGLFFYGDIYFNTQGYRGVKLYLQIFSLTAVIIISFFDMIFLKF